MLSDAIASYLKAVIPEFDQEIGDLEVYAEVAPGKGAPDSYAIVRTTTAVPENIDQGRTDYVRTSIQVLVFGRSRADWLLAQRIATVLPAMSGECVVAPDESYHVNLIEHVNGPIQLRDDETVFYSANFSVDYRQSLVFG